MPKKKETFETNLERLAEIVEQAENSETPLDTSIALYKEGLQLAEKCGETLRRAEGEILILQRQAGQFTLEPFVGGGAAT